MALLSWDFIVLIVVAGIAGIPLSWYLISQWLNGFAYHVEVGYVAFVVSLCLVLVIALMTISLQVLKAATGNPVDSLRSE
jgi:putative ABC transport system permease protein